MPLVLTPLPARDSLSDFPFQYNIGIAVRRKDKEFKDSLEAVLTRRQHEVQAILKEYAVPLLPIEQGHGAEKGEAKASS